MPQMTRPDVTEALQDGPTTRKPHDTPFSAWTVLTADDADGVRWFFHVPTAALAATPAPAAEPTVTEALRREAWRFLDHITQQDYVGEYVNIDVRALDRFRAALAASPQSPEPTASPGDSDG